MFLEWLLLNQSIHLFLLSVLCNPHISHVDFTELGKLWPPFVFTLFIWVSFVGSKTSPWRLRIYVNGKANGQFLTMSFGKQWGYKLRKSCCLHTDLSLSATGVEGGQCNPKASVLNIESFSNLKWFGNIERMNASQIWKGTSIWRILLQCSATCHSFFCCLLSFAALQLRMGRFQTSMWSTLQKIWSEWLVNFLKEKHAPNKDDIDPVSMCGPQKEIQAKVTVLLFSLLRSKKRRAIKDRILPVD